MRRQNVLSYHLSTIPKAKTLHILFLVGSTGYPPKCSVVKWPSCKFCILSPVSRSREVSGQIFVTPWHPPLYILYRLNIQGLIIQSNVSFVDFRDSFILESKKLHFLRTITLISQRNSFCRTAVLHFTFFLSLSFPFTISLSSCRWCIE